MWSHHYGQWMNIILKHYGSLDKFDDTRTIEIHLTIARQQKAELRAFLDSIPPSIPIEDLQPWNEELIKVSNIEADLIQWLRNRGWEV